MKKILFFAAVLAVASSCVDDGFDLSRVDAENISVGSGESTFNIPLANIVIKKDAIRGGNGSLEGMMNDADLLIPKSFGKVDLQNVPADALIDGLFDELRQDGHRREEVGKFLAGSKYRNEVVATLPANLRGLDLADAFTNHFGDLYARQELRDKMKEIIVKTVGSINDTMPAVDVVTDGFGIDEAMVDMLTGPGEIRLCGTVTEIMPFDGKAFLVLQKNDGNGETIAKLELPLDHADSSEDAGVIIDNAALRAMTRKMKMRVSLDLSSYYPGEQSADADGKVLKIALKLKKQGGLNISGIFED